MKKFVWIILPSLFVFFITCKNQAVHLSETNDTIPAFKSNYYPTDTLRAVTQYGATSYFIYQDEKMGYDYELAKSLAAYLKLPLKIEVVKNDSVMRDYLREGLADIVIHNTYKTGTLSEEFEFVALQEESYLVLVQLVSRDAVSDLTELKGKEVWVKENSPHHRRLQKLNDEIGGGISIRFANDSLSSDDLMLQVANKEIPITVAYRKKALLQKTFSRHLDCRIPIGFNQQNGWIIRKENRTFLDSINQWCQAKSTKITEQRLKSAYWDKNPYFAFKKVHIPKGAVSPFDEIFREAAKRIGWDWRLLAAVGYAESGYDSTVVSWAGASGVMQLMPGTALNFGVDSFDIFNPRKSIFAGAEYIKSLDMIYRKIEDKEERIKFILASYNSGPAPILDAMALAEKYGKDRYIWFENVEYYLEKLDEPEFYNDPVVKYGSFRGGETLRYVPYVLDTYQRYLMRK